MSMLALRSAEHQTLEIGYIFHPGYGGQGFATETVRALVDLAFHVIGARRIIARVDTRNRPSCTLLERVGFRLEAHLVENEWLKGELTSEYDYGLLAREWPRSDGVSYIPSSRRRRQRSSILSMKPWPSGERDPCADLAPTRPRPGSALVPTCCQE